MSTGKFYEFTPEERELYKCECPDCDCEELPDFRLPNGKIWCACCLADCPDVHPPEGYREFRFIDAVPKEVE